MYLVMKGISKRSVAMDVRQGPLSAARRNLEEFGLEDLIETRLSDGLEGLEKGEADSLVIAGMGGKLMMSILDKRDIPGLGIRTGVLQPQSDIREFRQYLRSRGCSIRDERIVIEDGKYYFPMLVSFSPDRDYNLEAAEGISRELEALVSGEDSGSLLERALLLSDCYGAFNIARRDEALLEYLCHGAEVDRSILARLDEKEHGERYTEVSNELSNIELLLKLFGH